MKIQARILLMICLIILFLGGMSWMPSGIANSEENPCRPGGPGQPGTCEKDGSLKYYRTPVAPSDQSRSDRFGYTWKTKGIQYAWMDAETGGFRVFTNEDDAISKSVTLPFPFPYYSQVYDEVYIGSNGLIGFDCSIAEKLAGATNLRIPLDYAFPQNFLAPFWSDLSGGEVWYRPDENGRYFVVEWRQVSQYQVANSSLTFQAILFPNGDILFQYAELTNVTSQVTIGIEDMQGTNGLQYLYNSTPELSGKAILYKRPEPSMRVEISPTFQSRLVIGGETSYQIMVTNAGDLALELEDVYNLQVISNRPGWRVELFHADGVTPLFNSDSNPLPDTGRVKQGDSFVVTVKVKAPGNAKTGDSSKVSLVASSSEDPDRAVVADLVSSLPAPFAHIYYDAGTDPNQRGLYIELISLDQRKTSLVNNTFTTGFFSLTDTPQYYFLGLWERVVNSTIYNLEYMMLNSVSGKLSEDPILLTDNSSDPKRDIKPVSASTPDGKIGVVWVRSRWVSTVNNSNVWFAIRNAENTAFLYGPVNVTNDSGWHDQEIYNDPVIGATEDNQFHLGWVQSRIEEGVTTNDIGHASYTSGGVQTTVPSLISTQQDDVNYLNPSIVSYRNPSNVEHVLITYFREDGTNPLDLVYDLMYGVLNTDGSVDQSQAVLYEDYSGAGMDSVRLVGGKIVLAWTDQVDQRINYTYLNQDLTPYLLPTALTNPDGRSSGKVSITYGPGGHAILIWMDVDFQGRLYYATLDHAGVVLVSPTILKEAQTGGTIHTRAGFSNSPYILNRLYYAPFVIQGP